MGRSQAENTWKIFDAIAEGNVKEALEILNRVLEQGDEPLKILGAFSMQLRRLAQAGRLAQQNVPLPAVLEQAGAPRIRRRLHQADATPGPRPHQPPV